MRPSETPVSPIDTTTWNLDMIISMSTDAYNDTSSIPPFRRLEERLNHQDEVEVGGE